MKRPAVSPKPPPPCKRCFRPGILQNGAWVCPNPRHGPIFPDLDPKGGKA